LIKTQDINDKDMAPLGVTALEVIAHPWWMKTSSNERSKNLFGSFHSQRPFLVNPIPQEPFWFIVFPMVIPRHKEQSLGTQ
jgi:hypothetical protein